VNIGFGNMAGQSAQPFKQLCQFDFEAFGDLLNAEERQIALSALDLADVRPVQAAMLLRLLLRPSTRVPEFPDSLAERTRIAKGEIKRLLGLP